MKTLKEKQRSKVPLFIFGYLLLLGMLVLSLTIIRVNVVKASYRLQQSKIEKAELVQEVSEKEVVYSKLLTPARVEQLAVEKYKLSKPTPKQIVYFKSQE